MSDEAIIVILAMLTIGLSIHANVLNHEELKRRREDHKRKGITRVRPRWLPEWIPYDEYKW